MGKLKILAVMIVIFLTVSFITINAADNQPGSVSDPLVTKSYVDEQIGNVVELFSEILNGNEGNNTTNDINDTAQEPTEVVAATYKAIGPIPAGTIILGKEGTEIILRSGEASAVCPGENGLQDVTEGVDILGGLTVPLNHLIIVPREDGRGIQLQKDGYVMIRGDYTVE